MNNKNTPIFHYDEEKAKTNKSPIIIALTRLQQTVLIESIWKHYNVPNTPYCIERLGVIHTDVIPKYEERKFTHYVWVLSEDNVKDWLKTISRYRWITEDVLEWNNAFQMVFDKRYLATRSLQHILNEVVDDYVRVHGDPRPAINEKNDKPSASNIEAGVAKWKNSTRKSRKATNMLKTITMFQRDHEKFMKLIEDGTLPQPSMHFVTGPVHLGKEGKDEIVNDVYFHTFEIDKGNEELMRFFESIANYINTWLRSRQLPNNGYMEFVFDRKYCKFMRLYKNIEDTIIDYHVMSFSDVINTWLMQSIIIERRHKTENI